MRCMSVSAVGVWEGGLAQGCRLSGGHLRDLHIQSYPLRELHIHSCHLREHHIRSYHHRHQLVGQGYKGHEHPGRGRHSCCRQGPRCCRRSQGFVPACSPWLVDFLEKNDMFDKDEASPSNLYETMNLLREICASDLKEKFSPSPSSGEPVHFQAKREGASLERMVFLGPGMT
jgi:hypothetical protein